MWLCHMDGAICAGQSSTVHCFLLEGIPEERVHQHQLSSKIGIHQFNNILIISSVADKARLLSVSSPHAASWLTVVPSEGLGHHLEPSVFQVAVKWWLGLDTANGFLCALCSNCALDPLGHHATTCKKRRKRSHPPQPAAQCVGGDLP